MLCNQNLPLVHLKISHYLPRQEKQNHTKNGRRPYKRLTQASRKINQEGLRASQLITYNLRLVLQIDFLFGKLCHAFQLYSTLSFRHYLLDPAKTSNRPQQLIHEVLCTGCTAEATSGCLSECP